MKDLRDQLGPVWARLSAPVAPTRNVLVIAARANEGASSVAASLSAMAADAAHKSAWLVNLDVLRNDPVAAFDASVFGAEMRPAGQVFDAAEDGESFLSIGPSSPPSRLVAVRLGRSRLIATRFETADGQTPNQVLIRTAPRYWRRLSQFADWVFADAPSLSHSRAGLAIAAQMDGVLIVVKADETPAREVRALRQLIEDHGGRCLGIVLNQIRADARYFDDLAA